MSDAFVDFVYRNRFIVAAIVLPILIKEREQRAKIEAFRQRLVADGKYDVSVSD